MATGYAVAEKRLQIVVRIARIQIPVLVNVEAMRGIVGVIQAVQILATAVLTPALCAVNAEAILIAVRANVTALPMVVVRVSPIAGLGSQAVVTTILNGVSRNV